MLLYQKTLLYLSIKDINGNKKNWKIVKLLFSEKMNTNENLTIIGVVV